MREWMQGSSPAYFTEYESVSVFQSVYQKSLKSQLFPLSVSSLLSPGQTGRVMANKCSGCICVLPPPPPPPPTPPNSSILVDPGGWGAVARCWFHCCCSRSRFIWPQQKSQLTWPQPCSTRIFSSFVSCRKYDIPSVAAVSMTVSDLIIWLNWRIDTACSELAESTSICTIALLHYLIIYH